MQAFAIYVYFVIFVASLLKVEASAFCGGPDWRYSPHSSKCYKLFNTQIAWPMAEFRCAFQGSHHISVHDLNDNHFVAELAKQAGIVWLGAAQFGASKDYVWSDRSPFSFEHWRDSRRPNYHKGRKCTKLDGNTGEWLQSCCKVPAAYICQKPVLQLPGPIIEEPVQEAEAEQQQQQQQRQTASNNLRALSRMARFRQ